MNLLTSSKYIIIAFLLNIIIHATAFDEMVLYKIDTYYNVNHANINYGIILRDSNNNRPATFQIPITLLNKNLGFKENAFQAKRLYIVLNIPNQLYKLDKFNESIEKTYLKTYKDIITSIIQKKDDEYIINSERIKNTIFNNRILLNMIKNNKERTCYWYDISSDKWEKCTDIYDENKANYLEECNDKNMKEIKTLELHYQSLSDIYIFPKTTNVKNKITVFNKDANMLEDLISSKDINNFVDKNILDILDNKYKNIGINTAQSRFNFTYDKNNDSMSGNHILKLNTQIQKVIEKGNTFYIIPLSVNIQQGVKDDGENQKEIKVKFPIDKKLTNNALKHIIEEYYGIKIEDNLENYGFQINELPIDPIFFFKRDVMTEKHLIYSPLIYDEYDDIYNTEDINYSEKDIYQTCDNIFTDEYENMLKNINDKSNDNFSKFNDNKKIELILRNLTNYYSTEKEQIDPKNLKLEIKSIPLFIKVCEFEKKIQEANVILEQLKKAIPIVNNYKNEQIKKNCGVSHFQKYTINMTKKNEQIRKLINESLTDYFKNNPEKKNSNDTNYQQSDNDNYNNKHKDINDKTTPDKRPIPDITKIKDQNITTTDKTPKNSGRCKCCGCCPCGKQEI